MNGKAYIIGTGPGDEELLTVEWNMKQTSLPLKSLYPMMKYWN